MRRHPATVRRIHFPMPRICAFLAGWALSSGAAAPWTPGGAGRRLLLRLRLGALPLHLPTSSVPAGRRRLSPGTGAGGPDLGSLHWRGPLPPVRALLWVVGAGLRHVLAPLRVGVGVPAADALARRGGPRVRRFLVGSCQICVGLPWSVYPLCTLAGVAVLWGWGRGESHCSLAGR